VGLVGVTLALDSNICIDALDANQSGSTAAQKVLLAVRAGRADAILSALVFGEVLHVEDKDKQPPDMFSFVAALHHVVVQAATASICSYAGELRRQHGAALRLPDAIHLATAIQAGADCLITNDKKLTKAASGYLDVMTAGEFLAGLAQA